MKYAIVLPDGAADEPVERLENRTPLEAARIPNIDWIATHGRQGCVVTVPVGFSPGSDVATLSLLGYDPKVDHHGRAPLEAAAMELQCLPNEIIYRCNFVTIIDDIMIDFTAGHISQIEADRLIGDLNSHFAADGYQFHSGVSYRNLMVTSIFSGKQPQCTPPHDIPDQPVRNHRPRGPGAKPILRIMERAHEMLGDHDLNHVRRDLGENPATDIWLWGQGSPKPLQSFKDRFGLSAGLVAGVDLIRGIAKTIGMELLDVPGATGYLDTDYQAKGEAAVQALDRLDVVIVHIEAPDEAGHLGDADAKIAALERIDEHIVAPLLKSLKQFDAWKILIAPDHPTPVESRMHTRTPPPFCFAGSAVQPVLRKAFSEAASKTSDLHIDPGHEFMEYFLHP